MIRIKIHLNYSKLFAIVSSLFILLSLIWGAQPIPTPNDSLVVASQSFSDSSISFATKIVERSKEERRLYIHEQFVIADRPAFILWPSAKKRGKPQPWVLYAPVLRSYPSEQEVWMFNRLAEAGVAVAGIDVGESYGSPSGQFVFDQLYKELTSKRQFAKRPCLLARSRGGLWIGNWAANNPHKVAAIAGIYPVFDLRSYPGLQKAAVAYGMSKSQFELSLAKYNPIQQVQRLAKAGIPAFLLHGDADSVVPIDANSKAFVRKYDEVQASKLVTLQIAKGQRHNNAACFFRNEKFTEFIIERAISSVKEPE